MQYCLILVVMLHVHVCVAKDMNYGFNHAKSSLKFKIGLYTHNLIVLDVVFLQIPFIGLYASFDNYSMGSLVAYCIPTCIITHKEHEVDFRLFCLTVVHDAE